MKSLRKLSFQTALPYIALLSVAVLSVIPLFKIGVNTADDFQYYVTAQRSWKYWAMDHYFYAISGRFYFLITKYFYYIPYLLDNFFAAKVIQYGTLFLCYLLFAYLVGRVLHSCRAALLTLLILEINTVAAPPSFFIPITCYPFYFSFSLIIFLLGCLMYVNHYQQAEGKTKAWRPWVGSLLIFISFLFYETYLIFALMIGLYVFARHWRREGFLPALHNRALYHETLPLLIVAIIYVAIYIGYRIYLQTSAIDTYLYSGTSFNAATFSMANFWRVLYRCALIALPGQIYFYKKGLIADASPLLEGHYNSPFFILGHASPTTWICGLLAVALLWWLTRKKISLSWKQILSTLLIGITIAFLSHTLIALSEKYNTQWSSWIKGYVTTLYSYFGVAIFLMALIAASLKKIKTTGWRNAVRAFWCFLVFFFTILNGYSNEHLARALACNNNRIIAINHIGRSGYFDTLPKDAIVYTDALHRISEMSFAVANNTEDIEDLINLRSQHKLRCTYQLEKIQEFLEETPDDPIYLINAIETKKANELLVVIARIDNFNPDHPELARTSKADLYYLSPEKHYTVVYSSATGTHFTTIDAPRHEALTHSVITDERLNPWEIFISNMLLYNQYHE